MTARRLAAAHGIWRGRHTRTIGDEAYTVYAAVLLGLVVVAPGLRAVWIVAAGPRGVSMLTSDGASHAVAWCAAALWAGGLLLGRHRGPALLPPFPLHALTSSDIPRAVMLRRPLIRSTTVIVAALTGGALLIGAALATQFGVQLVDATAFVVAALATGIVTALTWLTGQVFPRLALALSMGIVAVAGLTLSAPSLLAFVPWGWVGAIYPTAGAFTGPLALLVAFTASFTAVAPSMLNRMTGRQLTSQAAAWERATAFSQSFDLGGAAAVYEAKPRIGRDLRAIRPGRHRAVTFLVRDLVGHLRTPGRSLGALAATATAGILLTVSLLPATPSALLAGAAGLLLYIGSGPLTKGVQHAAHVAGDYPLYGISDRQLVLLHTPFPVIAMMVTLAAAATTTALISGAVLGTALAGACAIGGITIALRLGNALKGPLPPTLLTPVSTPVGDLSVVMQVGWAFSDLLLALLAGLASAMIPASPIPVILLTIWVAMVLMARWKKRR